MGHIKKGREARGRAPPWLPICLEGEASRPRLLTWGGVMTGGLGGVGGVGLATIGGDGSLGGFMPPHGWGWGGLEAPPQGCGGGLLEAPPQGWGGLEAPPVPPEPQGWGLGGDVGGRGGREGASVHVACIQAGRGGFQGPSTTQQQL